MSAARDGRRDLISGLDLGRNLRDGDELPAPPAGRPINIARPSLAEGRHLRLHPFGRTELVSKKSVPRVRLAAANQAHETYPPDLGGRPRRPDEPAAPFVVLFA
jgi:hypothetical protein